MNRPRAAPLILLLVVSLLAIGKDAVAAGLQVAPISIDIAPDDNAAVLWLSNTGNVTLQAQVRVFRWTQATGADQLDASRALAVSPPMLELAAGARQLVRVVRLDPPPSATGAMEEAYRVLVDELPIPGAQQQGLQFVLRYSVPVFVGASDSTVRAPQLDGSLLVDGELATLQISNTGNTRAQLSAIDFVDIQGARRELTAGLLGYVLPGARMHWALSIPPQMLSAGGKIMARINGGPVEQPIATIGPRR
jgi:fimbrial chaperone protein